MDLNEALTQIAEIRTQIAKNETFRGYRAGTVAISGVLALAGAAAQAFWIAEPAEHVDAYLRLWIGVAAASFAIFVAEIAVRSFWHAGAHARQLTLLAVEQFMPCIVVGSLLTYAIIWAAPGSVALLPGLWALVFSLGIFASNRLLPRATLWVAGYYLVAGTAALLWSRETWVLSPWAMAATFGAGQLLAAAVLYFTLEHNQEDIHAEE